MKKSGGFFLYNFSSPSSAPLLPFQFPFSAAMSEVTPTPSAPCVEEHDDDLVMSDGEGGERFTYEQQRWFPWAGWGKKSLPTDNPEWGVGKAHSKREVAVLPLHSEWSGPWQVDKEIGDSDGWEYAGDWWWSYHDQKKATDCVRRRRWVRPYVHTTQNSDDELVITTHTKKRFGLQLNSDTMVLTEVSLDSATDDANGSRFIGSILLSIDGHPVPNLRDLKTLLQTAKKNPQIILGFETSGNSKADKGNFQTMFGGALPASERQLDAFKCTYTPNKTMGRLGSMYITTNYVCFHSRMCAPLILPFAKIVKVEKKSGALMSGITVMTKEGSENQNSLTSYNFSGFFSRENAFALLERLHTAHERCEQEETVVPTETPPLAEVPTSPAESDVDAPKERIISLTLADLRDDSFEAVPNSSCLSKTTNSSVPSEDPIAQPPADIGSEEATTPVKEAMSANLSLLSLTADDSSANAQTYSHPVQTEDPVNPLRPSTPSPAPTPVSQTPKAKAQLPPLSVEEPQSPPMGGGKRRSKSQADMSSSSPLAKTPKGAEEDREGMQWKDQHDRLDELNRLITSDPVEKDEQLIACYKSSYKAKNYIDRIGTFWLTDKRVIFTSAFITPIFLPFTDITEVSKKKDLMILNAIQIKTESQTITFTAFMQRDAAFSLLENLWSVRKQVAVEPAKPAAGASGGGSAVGGLGGVGATSLSSLIEPVGEDADVTSMECMSKLLHTVCPKVSTLQFTPIADILRFVSESKGDISKNIITGHKLPKDVALSSVFDLLLSNNSSFLSTYHGKRNTYQGTKSAKKKIKIPAWNNPPDYEKGGIGSRDFTATAVVYAPWEKHTRYIEGQRYGCFVENKSPKLVFQCSSQTPDVTYGESFRVESALIFTEVREEESVYCTLDVVSHLHFFSNPLVKGKIVSSAATELGISYKMFTEMANKFITKHASQACTGNTTVQGENKPAGGDTVAAADDDDDDDDALPSTPEQDGPDPIVIAKYVGLGLPIFWMVWYVLSLMSSVSALLNELTVLTASVNEAVACEASGAAEGGVCDAGNLQSLVQSLSQHITGTSFALLQTNIAFSLFTTVVLLFCILISAVAASVIVKK